MKTKAKKAQCETAQPFRLRQADHVALARLAGGRPLRDALHDAVSVGVRALEEKWEGRLERAEQVGKVFEAFSRRTLATLRLRPEEAVLVARALRPTALLAGHMGGDGLSPDLLRFDVHDAIVGAGGIVLAKTMVPDERERLLERVREWSPGDLVALLVGAMRCWAMVEQGMSEAKAVVAAGLVAATV